MKRDLDSYHVEGSMRVSPRLVWLEPYARLGLSFVNPNKELERIGALKYGTDWGSNEHAFLIQRAIGEPYRIWMHTHYTHTDAFSKIELLEILAHEIAHMEDWDHSAFHGQLSGRIYSAMCLMYEGETR